uniref:PH domain-containing protein n=1 Tax=Globisporangium ultimum (strain ATCC 200006 / CBS 805.95 / DAOM BR144) TaxID=431595 RepID=K3XB37_GLOUD
MDDALVAVDRETLVNATSAHALHSNGYQEFMDLFMVITVGIATFLVLFRVAFTLFPPGEKAKLPLATAAPGAEAAGANPRLSGSRAKTTAATSNASSTATRTPLKRHFSVKERLESEIRSILPRRSTYYTMPFFSDTVVNKQEFIESLIELGDDLLDGWLLVKKGVQRGKNWKKRFVVLDGNGRIKYYPNADAARRNINIKGSLAVHAVKPADPLEFGANTLEIRGTLGGTYFFRAEDDLAARKWLCVMTKRAIQGRVPGRIDSTLSSAVVAASQTGTGSSPNGTNGGASADAAENALSTSGVSTSGDAGSNASANLKSHSFEAFVEEMSYSKESSLRQFYVVVKYKSELHDHSNLPVGQSVPKPCEKGVVNWNEKLSWHFQDHSCAECDECRAIGSTSGTFCGLPDIMVLHVYEIHLRYLTTKVGECAISLREMFGFIGMKEAQVSCSWPVTSPSESILGQLSLKFVYSVNSTPGASLTPFLVSSEDEREFLGEYEIHPSVKTAIEFFELFYANGKVDKWQDYYKARGDTEMDIGEWTESKEYGGQVRVLSCRSLTNASIGPSSTMNTTTQHVFFADAASADPDKFVLESKVFLHDIPYGDCFTVEQVFVVEKSAAGTLIAKAYLGIPFSKGCMFKSKIISATREGVSSSTKLMYEMLNKAIDNPSLGMSSAPVTPFLVSKEEERSMLGEYEVHPAVKDGLHFFDLYYANNVQKMWEGYYKAGGDSEHDISEWADSQEFGGQVRTIKYRAQSNSSLGPPSTTATQTQHVYFNGKKENADPDRFILETKMAMHDIPYGDSFTIETVFEVTREVDGKLLARAYIGIPFSKSTMFKSKIASATKEGVVKSTKMLFEELKKAMDKETSSADGAVTKRESSSSGTDAIVARNSDVGNKPTPPRRAVLARYNSNLDGSVALEEIFENQRVSIFGKWGPNHLLPTDRERFTNRNGDIELSFEHITLPPHWIWTSPWKIDKNYTECDDEGWSYATDFPRFKMHLARGKSSMKRLGASVRRRRWIRMMCYVPPENGNGAVTPTA